MATQAQIEANRANARRSTGPRTEAGKAAARANATRHGLTGKQLAIQGEDEAAYEGLRQDLIDSYRPANAAEQILVDEIAQSFWRLQRARAIEADTYRLIGAGADPIIAFRVGASDFDNIRRYMTAIERAYHRAMQQLERTQSLRRRHPEPSAPSQPEIGFVSQPAARRPQALPQPTPIDAPRQETNPRATIKFDPLPGSTATSNN